MIDVTIKVASIAFRKGSWAALRTQIVEVHEDDGAGLEVGRSLAVSGEFDRLGQGALLRVFGEASEYRGAFQLKAKSATIVVGEGLEDLRAFARLALSPLDAMSLIARHPSREALLAIAEGTTPPADDLESAFRSAYVDNDALAESMRWLLDLDATDEVRARILRDLGARAKAILLLDPYAPLTKGWDFSEADEFAIGCLDIALDDPRRRVAAVTAAILSEEAEGHTWVPKDEIHTSNAIAGRFEAGELEAAAIEAKMLDPDGVKVQRSPISWAEENIARRLAVILNTLKRPIEAGELDPKLSDEQRDAVEKIRTGAVLVLVGGAGVGKSHATKEITKTLARVGGVLLAAPTGKAARRLAQATGRPASTLHRALGVLPTDGWVFNAGNRWPTSAVVLDEVSMVDTELFSAALDATPDDARIVFVGDPGQLPSVGPGAVLRDLLAEPRIPRVTLTKIFRQAEDSSIPHAAKAIREGRVPSIGGRLSGPDIGFKAFEKTDTEELFAFVVDRATNKLREAGKNRRAFKASEIYILSPQNKGPLGTRAFNVACQEAVNPVGASIYIRSDTKARAGDRVIHVENDYDLGVFNGETGYVQEISEGDVGVEVDTIERDENGKPRRARDKKAVLSVAYEQPDGSFRLVGYSATKARSKLELAYAISVHKSQGSTIPAVVMVCSSHHRFMLARSLLYTGVTRASEYLLLAGDGEAIKRAVGASRGEGRRSTLKSRLARCLSAPPVAPEAPKPEAPKDPPKLAPPGPSEQLALL